MMRLEKYSISRERTEEILKNNDYGVLSLINTGNMPYAVPLNYVYFENGIFFHCAKKGEKINAINNNDNACFTVVGKVKVKGNILNTEYESAMIFGKIREISEEAEKERILVRLVQKYTDLSEALIVEKCESCKNRTGVYRISVDKSFGKSNIGLI